MIAETIKTNLCATRFYRLVWSKDDLLIRELIRMFVDTNCVCVAPAIVAGHICSYIFYKLSEKVGEKEEKQICQENRGEVGEPNL